jgi:hypothetical protein
MWHRQDAKGRESISYVKEGGLCQPNIIKIHHLSSFHLKSHGIQISTRGFDCLLWRPYLRHSSRGAHLSDTPLV